MVRFSICILIIILSAFSQAENPVPQPAIAPVQAPFSSVNIEGIERLGGLVAMVVDGDGFLWFGGEGGLARFDGYRLKFFGHAEKKNGDLSHHFITGLLVDRQKQLWVATHKGLNIYNPTTQTFTHLHTEHAVELLYQDASGTVWAAFVGAGLQRYNVELNRFSPHTLKADNHFTHFFTAFEDAGGSLWFGGDNGALRVEKNGDVTHFQHRPSNPQSLSHNAVRVIYQDSYGVLWLGTEKGLNRFEPEHGTFIKPRDPSLKQRYISAMAEDDRGQLWVATDGDGLFYRAEAAGLFAHYSVTDQARNGMVNDHVRFLSRGPSGRLWAGHYPAGVSRSVRSSTIFRNGLKGPAGTGLTNADVLSVAEDAQGHLWVGTEGGLNRIDNNTGETTHFVFNANQPQGLPANPVIALAADSAKVLVGTWPGGLSALPLGDNHFTPYTGPHEMIAPAFIFIDSQQRTWVGLQAGLALLDAGENWPQGRLLSAKAALSIVETVDGNFWVGEYGRLMQLNVDGELIKSYHFSPNQPEGLPDAAILAMVEDAEHNLWLATRAGAILFNPSMQTFTRYTEADGLPSNTVNCVVEEDAQRLWFATQDGLARLNRDTGVFSQFTTKDGLPGNTYKSKTCLRLRGGDLVFGSTQGLTRFNPKRLSSEQKFPAVTLTSFEVLSQGQHLNWPLQQPLAQAHSVTLPYPHSAFELTFSALNFAEQEQQYAYYLKGVEQDWTFVGTVNSATYTNLRPGRYVFRVQAASDQGAWSNTGRELVVVIGAPWWAAGWLRGLLLVLLCVLGYGAWRVRKSRQKAPEQLLGEQNELPAFSPQKVADALPKIMAGMEQDQLFLDHNLSLKSFAQHIDVNARDVSKVLNSHVNCTFLEFVSRYRVAEAKRLLLADSDNSVTDIMLKSGFNTKSAFYRVFKAECGITPSEYRAGAAKSPR